MKLASVVILYLTGAFFAAQAYDGRPVESESNNSYFQQDDSQSMDASTRPGYEANEPAPAMPEETQPVESTTHTEGDVLDMPRDASSSTQEDMSTVRVLDFPRRGMKTATVEKELGRPNEVKPAIGQPPITRWIYDDRIVYFEYDSVIHVVAR